MENTQTVLGQTLENKAKFQGLYFGIKCLKDITSPKSTLPVMNPWSSNLKTSFLELKPLSSISDEDAKEIGRICGDKRPVKDCLLKSEKDLIYTRRGFSTLEGMFSIGFNTSHVFNPMYDNALQILDFLRSRGYALPWMGLSVKQLIEYGWIKLKED